MAKKTRDRDAQIARMARLESFLPPPTSLVAPQETVKVTLSLSKSSVVFFKEQAKLYNAKYQRMIRQLVDIYALWYQQEK